MKIATVSRILLLALVLVSTGGCTPTLWGERKFSEFNRPAPDPHLSLYSATSRKDFLVVYDESSERNDSIQRRAYWLNKNEERTKEKRYPLFVDTTLARGLISVPVFSSTNEPRIEGQQVVYAIVSTNNIGFTLFSSDLPIGSHQLPVYDDGKGVVARIVLTPLTITADAALVGCFLGYMYCQGAPGTYYNFH